MRRNLGQVALGFLLSFATASVIVAGFIWDIKGDIRVIEERENNHYDEIQKSLGRIEIALGIQ